MGSGSSAAKKSDSQVVAITKAEDQMEVPQTPDFAKPGSSRMELPPAPPEGTLMPLPMALMHADPTKSADLPEPNYDDYLASPKGKPMYTPTNGRAIRDGSASPSARSRASPTRAARMQTSAPSSPHSLVSRGSQTTERRSVQEARDDERFRRRSLRQRCLSDASFQDVWGAELPPSPKALADLDREVRSRDEDIMSSLMDASSRRASALAESRESSRVGSRHCSQPASPLKEANEAFRGSNMADLMTARFGEEQGHQQRQPQSRQHIDKHTPAKPASQQTRAKASSSSQAQSQELGELSVDALVDPLEEKIANSRHYNSNYDEAFIYSSQPLPCSRTSSQAAPSTLYDSESSSQVQYIYGPGDALRSPHRSESRTESLEAEAFSCGDLSAGDSHQSHYHEPPRSLTGLVLSGTLGASAEYRSSRRKSNGTLASSSTSSYTLPAFPSTMSWTMGAPPSSPVGGGRHKPCGAELTAQAWSDYQMGAPVGGQRSTNTLASSTNSSVYALQEYSSTMSWTMGPPPSSPAGAGKHKPSAAELATQAWSEFREVGEVERVPLQQRSSYLSRGSVETSSSSLHSYGGVHSSYELPSLNELGDSPLISPLGSPNATLEALDEDWDLERAESVIANPAMPSYMASLYERSASRAAQREQERASFEGMVSAYLGRRFRQCLIKHVQAAPGRLARAMRDRDAEALELALVHARAAGLYECECRKAEVLQSTHKLLMSGDVEWFNAPVGKDDVAESVEKSHGITSRVRSAIANAAGLDAQGHVTTCDCAPIFVPAESRSTVVAAMHTALSVEGTPLENLAAALHMPSSGKSMQSDIDGCLDALHCLSSHSSNTSLERPKSHGSSTLRLIRELSSLGGKDIDTLLGFPVEERSTKNLAPQVAMQAGVAWFGQGGSDEASCEEDLRIFKDMEAWAKVGISLTAAVEDLSTTLVAESLRTTGLIEGDVERTEATICSDHVECQLSLRKGLAAYPELYTLSQMAGQDCSTDAPLAPDLSPTPCLFLATASEDLVAATQVLQQGDEVVLARPCSMALRPYAVMGECFDPSDTEGDRNFFCIVEGAKWGVPLWSQLPGRRREAHVLMPMLTRFQVVGTPLQGVYLSSGGPAFSFLRLRCCDEDWPKLDGPRWQRLQDELRLDDAWLAARTLQLRRDHALQSKDIGAFLEALADTSRHSEFRLNSTCFRALGRICNKLVGRMEAIDLSWRSLGELGVEAVAGMLERTKHLKHLRLSGNSIGDLGVSRLGKAIQRNSTLKTLSLGENRLTNAGVKHLANALAAKGSLSNLQDLWLQRNSIGDKGAYYLAAALQHNSRLQQLYLMATGIGDAGAGRLASALQVNESLKDLYLHENKIGNSGSEHLAGALRSNGVLRRLALHGNPIGEDGAKRLMDAWSHSRSLQELHLPSCLLSKKPPHTAPAAQRSKVAR